MHKIVFYTPLIDRRCFRILLLYSNAHRRKKLKVFLAILMSGQNLSATHVISGILTFIIIFQNYMGIAVKSKLNVIKRWFQWILCLLDYFFSLKLGDNFNMYFYFWLLILKWCFSITDHYSIKNITFIISVDSFPGIRSIHDEKNLILND